MMSLGSFYERPLTPMCPHTVVRNGEVLHTCADPMVEVASRVFECPNDHSGRRVRKRKPRLFPDLPREKPGGKFGPINAQPRVMSSPFNPGALPPRPPDPVGKSLQGRKPKGVRS